MPTILIPSTFSIDRDAALPFALELALGIGARAVRLVTFGDREIFDGKKRRPTSQNETLARELEANSDEELALHFMVAQKIVTDRWLTSEAVLRLAEAEKVDWIFLPMPEKSSFLEAILQEIMPRAACPLLLFERGKARTSAHRIHFFLPQKWTFTEKDAALRGWADRHGIDCPLVGTR